MQYFDDVMTGTQHMAPESTMCESHFAREIMSLLKQIKVEKPIRTSIFIYACLFCAHACDQQVAKFKIHQFFLEIDSPNLILAKFNARQISPLYGNSYCYLRRAYQYNVRTVSIAYMYKKGSNFHIWKPLMLHFLHNRLCKVLQFAYAWGSQRFPFTYF